MTRTERQADWIGITSAQTRVLHAIEPLPSETVPLSQAMQRTLASSITSPITDSGVSPRPALTCSRGWHWPLAVATR